MSFKFQVQSFKLRADRDGTWNMELETLHINCKLSNSQYLFMSEHFYTSIAKYYQHIFPLNPAQIKFLSTILPYNGARVMEK